MYSYTQDLITGLWLVMKGSAVIGYKKTPEEAEEYIAYLKSLDEKKNA